MRLNIVSKEPQMLTCVCRYAHIYVLKYFGMYVCKHTCREL